MKQIITLLCAAAISLGTMHANVLLTESFIKEAGTLNVGPNTDMGTNTSSWWSYSGSSNYIQVAEGSLSYAGYKAEGEGNKAYLYSGGADDFRKFAEVNSGKVYMAAIVNIESVKNSITADYFMTLGDGCANGQFAKLYTKSVKDGDEWIGFHFGVAKSAESATYVGVTEEVYEAGVNYLVVVEYEFVDGEKNDTARLYINPTASTTVPTLVCVQHAQSGSGAEQGANCKSDAGKIASVNLRQGSNTPKVYVDEIKVATSWSELFEEGGSVDPGDNPGGSGDDPVIPSSNTIAAAKLLAADELAEIGSEPLVVRIFSDGYTRFITVQDETGALTLADYYDALSSWQIGDKISGLTGYVLSAEDFAEGFFTIFPASGSVSGSGNELSPIEVSLADFTQYGPAFIKVTNVAFDEAVDLFAAGNITISQNDVSAILQIPGECNIIGEAVPASADIVGLVCHPYFSNNILLNKSEDVTNRVARGTPGLQQVQKDNIPCTKIIEKGVLYLKYNGKKYNVQGGIEK